MSHRCAVDQILQRTSSCTNFQKNMKQRGDDYGSTLSLLNVQNGHLLLPLTCVLSILDLRILSQFSATPGTSLVGRRSLKNDTSVLNRD